MWKNYLTLIKRKPKTYSEEARILITNFVQSVFMLPYFVIHTKVENYLDFHNFRLNGCKRKQLYLFM